MFQWLRTDLGVDADPEQPRLDVVATIGRHVGCAHALEHGKLLKVVHVHVHAVAQRKGNFGLGFHWRVEHDGLWIEARLDSLRELPERRALAAQPVALGILQNLQLRVGLGCNSVEKVRWESRADGLKCALHFREVPDNCQRCALAQRSLRHRHAHRGGLPWVAIHRQLGLIIGEVRG